MSYQTSLVAPIRQSLPFFTEPLSLDDAKFQIWNLGKNLAEHAYLIGKLLIWVKEKVGHGNFLGWLNENIWFSERTAQNFMSFTSKCEMVAYLLEYHPSQPHVSHASGDNEWYTPPEYIEAAYAVMGSIDLDPASSDKANEIVKASHYFTKENDGRDKEWPGNVWMNPPYAQPLVKDFSSLLVKKYKAGEIKQACVLVNNATETEFYQAMLGICKAVCFIKGRVKFVDPEGKPSGAPLQGQTILYFGSNVDSFVKHFQQYGVVLHAD